jgi:SAM-dependent methyltransferase
LGDFVNVLYVGCGYDTDSSWLPLEARVTRLDIDPACEPDIVADMLAMGDIGPFDAVLSVHSLEHLYPHQVPQAVSEFHRVLGPEGYVICVVPDLGDVRPTPAVLMETPAGPVSGLDLYYGLRSALPENPYMAHHTGFTVDTIGLAFEGFRKVTAQRLSDYNLVAVAQK